MAFTTDVDSPSGQFNGWHQLNWTLADIEKLHQQGKIKSYKIINPKKADAPDIGGRKVTKHFSKKSKAKDFIAWNLLIWSQEKMMVLEEEYKFNPDRKWRFDWCIPKLMIAIEFEGGIFDPNGSHRRASNMQRDVDKYNSAQALGWKVLRFTSLNYSTLMTELNKNL